MQQLNALFAQQLRHEEEDEVDESIYVQFTVGLSVFALPIHFVVEVVETPKLTPYPIPCKGHLGVTNVRGKILPVIDFRGLGASIDDESRMIVVELPSCKISFLCKRPKRIQLTQDLMQDTTANVGGVPVKLLGYSDFQCDEADYERLRST